MYVIKHIANNYDVFSGEGYNHYSRIRVDHQAKTAQVVTGQVLPKNVLDKLVRKLNRQTKYQTISI